MPDHGVDAPETISVHIAFVLPWPVQIDPATSSLPHRPQCRLGNLVCRDRKPGGHVLGIPAARVSRERKTGPFLALVGARWLVAREQMIGIHPARLAFWL